ncbi:hypothetical protein [Mesorhizobium sp. ES1-1]|uniref:hypothetical protein n=1 Tax=Mesorhizobium sp. ES1-1 TaxID=2876629 RepID=UPI001CCF80A6|nr:hypothetical protein [Mesorhizobium sp. ES1-1]MBZ9674869.1 hypothetical protein [Mesorhizobium sp. ES1-1]
MNISSLWQSIKTYAAHPDPLVATANTIALVVVSNQPFYPLYLYWLVGPDVAPSYWLFLSTPFFALVPAISRLNTVAGRLLLPLAGIANTMLSAKVFGVASGVEMFLIPCVLIGFVVFRPSERIIGLAIAGLAFLIFTMLHRAYGQPVHLYTAEEYANFIKLNATSVGTLTAFVGMLAAGLIDQRGRTSS